MRNLGLSLCGSKEATHHRASQQGLADLRLRYKLRRRVSTGMIDAAAVKRRVAATRLQQPTSETAARPEQELGADDKGSEGRMEKMQTTARQDQQSDSPKRVVSAFARLEDITLNQTDPQARTAQVLETQSGGEGELRANRQVRVSFSTLPPLADGELSRNDEVKKEDEEGEDSVMPANGSLVKRQDYYDRKGSDVSDPKNPVRSCSSPMAACATTFSFDVARPRSSFSSLGSVLTTVPEQDLASPDSSTGEAMNSDRDSAVLRQDSEDTVSIIPAEHDDDKGDADYRFYPSITTHRTVDENQPGSCCSSKSVKDTEENPTEAHKFSISQPSSEPCYRASSSSSSSSPSAFEATAESLKQLVMRRKQMSSRQTSFVSNPYYSSLRRAPRAGAIITSARLSRRRSSNWAAVKAFAIATAASASCRRLQACEVHLKPQFQRASLPAHFNLFPPPGFPPAQGTSGGMKGLDSDNSSIHLASTETLLPASAAEPPATSCGSVVVSTAIMAPVMSQQQQQQTALSVTSQLPVVTKAESVSTSSSSFTPSGILVSSGGPLQKTTGSLSTAVDGPSREAVIAGMTVLRVLNVTRHWDFEDDHELKSNMQLLLGELLRNPRLNPSNQKVAFQLSREVLDDQLLESRVDLDKLMTPTQVPSKENFDTIAALDIAEQLTYLDFQIFRSIRTDELLNQAWMKDAKETKAPHVTLVSKRFNEVSKLVVSELVSRKEIADRAACIEKWTAIADICRCLQNYNGVLQICAALENSSIHRLKQTWQCVTKQSKQTVEKLLSLVTTNARFKNMREALHRCDPPCIPYLGMYLTDLSFIEEGTPNVTEHGLINFCKMRMLAHVLMEIRRYHQAPYAIKQRQEVIDYLLDPTRLLTDDQTYEASLAIEPRRSFDQKPITETAD
nr:unnamed protein product [Spirometra erinaceieuropaei]